LSGISETPTSNAVAQKYVLEKASEARSYGANDIQLILIDNFEPTDPMPHRLLNIASIVCLVLCVQPITGQCVAEDAIPLPSVTRIDYSRPENYLVLHESMESEARIREVAAKIKAKTAEQTLLAINEWISRNLHYDDSAAYSWRSFDQVVDDHRYGGCADYALVFASLSRACGIPTVFVKTMDVSWIVNYRQSGIEDSWSGHVFLEVYIDGGWRLLDPEACVLYENYIPASRILPGLRYAYDKGSDPGALVLSTDWERWKKQTAAHFSQFDLSELFNPATLPAVGAGRALTSPNEVYIAANSPIWEALTERCQTLGFRVRKSFNNDFDQFLPMAKGSRLIVACVGDKLVLPKERQSKMLPLASDELQKRVAHGESGVAERRLADGTTVILVYAKDNDAMLRLIKTLTIPANS
jgi:hypothetical protein